MLFLGRDKMRHRGFYTKIQKWFYTKMRHRDEPKKVRTSTNWIDGNEGETRKYEGVHKSETRSRENRWDFLFIRCLKSMSEIGKICNEIKLNDETYVFKKYPFFLRILPIRPWVQPTKKKSDTFKLLDKIMIKYLFKNFVNY